MKGAARVLKATAAPLMLLTAAACASNQTTYNWHDYSGELLDYYKDPAEIEKFAERLRTNIDEAESEDRIPPGMYAEYGYAMLELGDEDKAVEYFAKEMERWPESAFLMTKVIGRLQGAPAGTETTE